MARMDRFSRWLLGRPSTRDGSSRDGISRAARSRASLDPPRPTGRLRATVLLEASLIASPKLWVIRMTASARSCAAPTRAMFMPSRHANPRSRQSVNGNSGPEGSISLRSFILAGTRTPIVSSTLRTQVAEVVNIPGRSCAILGSQIAGTRSVTAINFGPAGESASARRRSTRTAS